MTLSTSPKRHLRYVNKNCMSLDAFLHSCDDAKDCDSNESDLLRCSADSWVWMNDTDSEKEEEEDEAEMRVTDSDGKLEPEEEEEEEEEKSLEEDEWWTPNDYSYEDVVELRVELELQDMPWEEAEEWENRLTNVKWSNKRNIIVNCAYQRRKKCMRHFRNRERPLRRQGAGSRYNYVYTDYSAITFSYEKTYMSEIQRAVEASMAAAAAAAEPVPLACGLTAEQINDLSNRELTPEDYELLLQLDEQVKPKTVEKRIVDALPRLRVTSGFLEELYSGEIELCTVCLTNFEVDDTLIELPCYHIYHESCIESWLTSSSVNCPLDNLPVSG